MQHRQLGSTLSILQSASHWQQLPSDPTILYNTPAGIPPPGVVPNFVDPPSTGGTYVLVGSVFLAIMVSFVLLRIYYKLRIAKRFTPDDCKTSKKSR